MDAAVDATLFDVVARRAAHNPAKVALTFVNVTDDGRYEAQTRTFAQLRENGLALASTLATLGLQRGETFGLMMPNHPEFVEAMIAAAVLGVVFVPIDPRTIGDKLQFMLKFAECRGLICTADCADAVAASGITPTLLSWAIILDGDRRPALAATVTAYGAALASASTVVLAHVPPESTMMMMFTSGTTGNPKAVVIPHGAYMGRARGMHGIEFRADDVLYTGLSLTHINAQGTLRIGLVCGIPVVISRKFSKTHLWAIIRQFGCTIFNVLGGMIPEIYSIPERPDDADNPVRLIISAGMPADLWTEYERRYGVRICEIYGSTEGGGALTNPLDAGPIGSIGKPPPDLEAAVFDEAGRRCPPFEPGELRFRRLDGQPSMVRYFKAADASAAKVKDGWFRSGDIAHVDESGWFYFHYRVGGGVRRNGDFVNTALVEAALIKSGLVADTFVYGVSTDRNVAGEKTLVAAVVPKNADFDVSSLKAFCRERLQKSDVPDIIQVLEAIPKTISEKPIERACIERLQEANLVS